MHATNQGLVPRSKKDTEEASERACGGRKNSMEPTTMTVSKMELSQQE